jgi:amino acid transporter
MSSPSHLLVNRFKRFFIGKPKRTDQAHQERLSVFSGLAVFSSDAISSVAYATEEILVVLATAGAVASAYSLSVGLAIVGLVFIVAASYNQTIKAYPSGGGSYIVSKDNLGINAGLIAGAALLVDYVLTVAVSTAAGVAAITSAIPGLHGYDVILGLFCVALIAWVNLRGVKESGTIFAIPTYSFLVAMFLLIGVGAYKAITGDIWHPAVAWQVGFGMSSTQFKNLTSGVTMFMLLRAFASGCTALSGIEAVSNGVQAFKAPEAENAIKTMKLERTILYLVFTGVTVLAYGFRLMPQDHNTVLSQIAQTVFGNSFLYYYVQATTALILLLAANTAYADFPRLTGMIARDGYLPRRLANLSDTLVFHYGVFVLAGLSALLIVIFRGSVNLLIPLYAIGVFLAFTMSQTGMVVHWLKIAKQPGESLKSHAWSIFINGLGALLSGVALVVIASTKFLHGAWIVCIIIPALVAYFRHVHTYYARFHIKVDKLLKEHMTIDDASTVKVVLTIGGLSPVIDHSMRVAHRMSNDVTAVYVATDPELGEKLARKWDIERHGGTPLVVLASPYRDVVSPLRKYLNRLQQEHPTTLINLLVPVIVTNEPFDNYLHNGHADQLIRELRFSEGIVITEIPFYVDMDHRSDRVIAYRPTIEGDD